MVKYTPKTCKFKGNNYPTMSATEFASSIKAKEQLYEVIVDDGFCKLYFDVDYKMFGENMCKYDLDEATFVEERGLFYIQNGLKTVLPELTPNIAIDTSHSPDFTDEDGIRQAKYSVRYFVSNVKTNKDACKEFAGQLNKMIESGFDGNDNIYTVIEDNKKGMFDLSVYYSEKKMRCTNTSKPNENRPLLLKSGTIEQTIITDFFDDDAVEFIYKKEKPEEQEIHDKNWSTEKLSKDLKNIENQIARLRNVSKLWKKNRINEYGSWLEFTWAIMNTFDKEGKSIWNELSKELYTRTDKPFDEEANKQIWDNEYAKKKKDRNCLTIATLYYWAKKDSPEEYEKLFNKFKIDWERLTQSQYAKMLCSDIFFGENVVFTGKKKEMQGFRYNGIYWVDLGLHNAEIKKDVFDRMYDLYMKEFLKIADQFNDNQKMYILKEIKILDNNGFRNNVIECLKTEKYVDKIEWNKDRDIFAFDDCIYNLKIGKFIKSSPTQYINWTCGYSYGKIKDSEGNIIYPEYFEEQEFCMKFIKSLFNDEDTIEYILKRCASYLKQMNSEEKADFWTGDGRNGKGTLTKLLTEMLGKYFGELNIGFYTTYEKSADSPNNNLFNLRNARLINTSEVGEDAKDANQAQRFITSQFKRITGGDRLVARQPHEKEQIEFYAGKVLIQTNKMPELVGIELPKNFSLRERVVVVRFTFCFTNDKKLLNMNPKVYKQGDNTLKEIIETNENLKRGFWKLLTSKFYPLYLTEGLTLPESVNKDTLSYFDASNKVKTWFDEHIEIDEPNKEGKFMNDVECTDIFTHFCNFNLTGFMKKAQFIEYLTNIVGKTKTQKLRGVISKDNRVYLRGYKYIQSTEAPSCLPQPQKQSEHEVEYELDE